MHNELINLLPPERQLALSREYLLRLGVVAAILLIALTVAAAMLLLPTYIFLSQSAVAKESHLMSVESLLSASNESSLSAQLANLSSDVAILTAFGNVPSASATLRTALAVPRPGIILSGFVYTPAVLKKPGTLVMSGAAVTRDALRRYQLAFSGASFVSTANLPVSAYAKDTDITFAISLTLAP